MTTITYLLFAISIGLAAALVATRRIKQAAPTTPDPDIAPPVTDEARMTAAAKLAPLGIIVHDEAGDRVFENAAAAAYTPITADDAVIGMRLRNLVAECRELGEPLAQEVELHGPSPQTVSLRAAPLLADGDAVGTVAFIEDLTTAARVDSMRTDFIANASHELKTPLGAMRLLADALIATERPEVSHDLAEKIQSEAERMTRLVEDILDLALEEGPAVQPEPVEICEVVGDALARLELLMETTGITVETSCGGVQVAGDHRRLASAIANIIENAISYTAVKGTRDFEPVAVTAWREGATAVIEIADRGIGIPERHQDRVFERFYRVDRGRSRDSGGTGLGLAIARHVVENHQGEISVESTSGVGSTFRIALPAVEP